MPGGSFQEEELGAFLNQADKYGCNHRVVKRCCAMACEVELLQKISSVFKKDGGAGREEAADDALYQHTARFLVIFVLAVDVVHQNSCRNNSRRQINQRLGYGQIGDPEDHQHVPFRSLL